MQLAKLNLPDVYTICSNLRADDAREVFATRWDDDPAGLAGEIIESWGVFGWVAMHQDTPVGLIGATEVWPHVWEAWMMATDDFPKIALGLTKFVKRRMIPELVGLGAQRCEARSIDGHTSAHRWMTAVGATQEARLRRYGRNGEDFLVFRWEANV